MKEELNKAVLYGFLRSKGFKAVEEDRSDSFGDRFEVLVSKTLKVRYVEDPSLESIDLASVKDEKTWYSLVLVKSLINKEDQLDKVVEISELRLFLVASFDYINKLFGPSDYSATKCRLEELADTWARQMLPNIT